MSLCSEFIYFILRQSGIWNNTHLLIQAKIKVGASNVLMHCSRMPCKLNIVFLILFFLIFFGIYFYPSVLEFFISNKGIHKFWERIWCREWLNILIIYISMVKLLLIIVWQHFYCIQGMQIPNSQCTVNFI